MARAKIILDSSIIIDLLLHNPPAITWSQSIDYSHAALTAITVMEALRGAHDKEEMDKIGRTLSRFIHPHILREDSQWAIRQFRKFWLSHQIGIQDCLIGAIVARTQLPLYTLNVKDFDPLPGVTTIRPY